MMGFMLVLQVAVILLACRALGSAFRRIQQPQVVGEMFAGIILGPSVLGFIAPKFSMLLFPASSVGALTGLSQLGIVIFMFLVGLRTDFEEMKSLCRTTILTSHASISIPFSLGTLLAIYLYPRLSAANVPFGAFAIFLGAAMSITAFPVLARILMEKGLLHSRLGTVAIGCAALDDLAGWCLLACIMVLYRVHAMPVAAWAIPLAAIAFCFLMVFGVRPQLRRLTMICRRQGELSESLLALVLLLVLFSALCTEWIGVHFFLGAFLMGVVLPKDQHFQRYILDRCETVTIILLMPLFFAVTGLRTRIDLIKGQDMWLCFALIVLVATMGKFGGSMLASFTAGESLEDAAGLGALLNTRGLMELVILNIGLELGIISPALFSMMVLMAILTTLMTAPILGWIKRISLVQGTRKTIVSTESFRLVPPRTNQ